MNAALVWLNAWSPFITGALGGGLAVLSSALLFMVATALGPDLPVMQCVGPRARFFMHLTALTWFIRGAMVLTGIGGPEARHPHWDMPLSWAMTSGLVGYAFLYIWKQRMPPSVRERFDRRMAFKNQLVKGLVAEGRTEDAERAADGVSPGMQQVYEVGVSSSTAQRLEDMP